MNMYGMGKLEMFAIYMDITTGDTLFTERYVEEFEPEMPGILFSEAVEMAQQVLDSVGVSATILGGEMYFGSEMYNNDGPDGEDYGFNGTSLSSRMGELRLNSSSLGLPMVLGEHEPFVKAHDKPKGNIPIKKVACAQGINPKRGMSKS